MSRVNVSSDRVVLPQMAWVSRGDDIPNGLGYLRDCDIVQILDSFDRVNSCLGTGCQL